MVKIGKWNGVKTNWQKNEHSKGIQLEVPLQ